MFWRTTNSTNDGRKRWLWSGELPDDEEEAQDYLEVNPGKLRVYRCPECEVRIAQENDISRHGSLKRGIFAATFKRTFNMVKVENSVCCCRCGIHLFPYDERDPAMLTLPLYWDGLRLFKKTDFRCVVVFDCADAPGAVTDEYGSMSSSFVPRAKGLVSLLSTLSKGINVHVQYFLRYKRCYEMKQMYKKKQEDELQSCLQAVVDHYQNQTGVRWTFFLVDQSFQVLDKLETIDFSLHLRVCGGHHLMCWTDASFDRWETVMLTLWMKCGGNYLFGDWFLPSETRPEDGTNQDFEAMAADLLTLDDEPGGCGWNNQPAFSQLIRDGHYLGHWSHDLFTIPLTARQKVIQAITHDLLYPRWLFLHDFPPSVFDNLFRRGGSFQIPESRVFASYARDSVVRRFRPRAIIRPDDNEGGSFASVQRLFKTILVYFGLSACSRGQYSTVSTTNV